MSDPTAAQTLKSSCTASRLSPAHTQQLFTPPMTRRESPWKSGGILYSQFSHHQECVPAYIISSR